MVGGEEIIFLGAIDISGETKNADFIAKELPKCIEKLGKENIVQVITDSAANCVAARNILSVQYKDIVFLPCAVHCLDLL